METLLKYLVVTLFLFRLIFSSSKRFSSFRFSSRSVLTSHHVDPTISNQFFCS
jgi:hypothetical protein